MAKDKLPEWGDENVYPPKMEDWEHWCNTCNLSEHDCICREPNIHLRKIVFKRLPKDGTCGCSGCYAKRKSKGKRKSDRKTFLVNTI